MKNPRTLSETALIGVVQKVQQALWPRGDAEHQWTPDTLDEIARALVDAGLGPESKRDV